MINISGIRLEARNIEKTFPGVQALKDVSISFDPGTVHGIVGENGAGKSTLIKCLSGVYQPEKGKIYLDGEEITFNNPRQAINKGIYVIHQEFSLVPYMSVAENIFLGSFPGKRGFVNDSEMNLRAKESIHSMGIDLDPRAITEDLSVAEQQFVEIVKTLSKDDASLMILDEPTAALNTHEVNRLFSLIREIKKKGLGLIFISHRLSEILEICDVITVMKDGEIVGTYDADEVSEDDLVSLMVGRELSYAFPDHGLGKSDVILEVKDIRSKLLNGPISFKHYKGEILGFYGLEGQGQRDMLRIMFGLEPHDSGDMILSGKKITVRNPNEAVKSRITYVPPDRKDEGLALNLSVLENITIPFCLKSNERVLSKSRLNDICDSVIDKFSIKTSSVNNLVRFLSGGNQQKIVIGKWMTVEPKVLLLDEPTRGVDVDSKMEIYASLRKLSEEGIGIILFTSDLIETIGLCDRLIVFYEKAISGILDWKDFDEETIMSFATGVKNSTTC